MIIKKIFVIDSYRLIKDIPIQGERYIAICRGDIDTKSTVEKKHDVLSDLDLFLRTYIIKCKDQRFITISWYRHEYHAFLHRSNPYIVLIKGDITDDILLSLGAASARDNGVGRV